MRSPEGLARVASYASGLGPWIPQVVRQEVGPLNSTDGVVARRRNRA